MSLPIVSTQSATSIGLTTATANGTLISTTHPITEYGFEWGMGYESGGDRVNIVDSLDPGAFTSALAGLTPGQNYSIRAYALSSEGVGYGEWVVIQTLPATYNVTINGVDRTTDVVNATLLVDDVLNDQQNTCQFEFIDRSGNGLPDNDEEIIITLDDGTVLFGGYITNVSIGSVMSTGKLKAQISAVDYSRLLDSNLVHKSFEDMTDKEIIDDIVATYCAGFGITTQGVIEGVTIDQISFNYLQPSQCLRKLCDLTGRSWYIDYSKDIHYFPLETQAAPFDVTADSAQYKNLEIRKDATQLKNRVYVRGGTYLSDFTVHEQKGDGKKRQFLLPDKPHDVTITVNGVAKTIGIKNIDTSGYDYYLNYQEKYVEQDAGATLLATTDTLSVTYKYDIPVLVAVENEASIAESGVKEFAIFDKSINSTQAARDRASAEIVDYAASLIEGSFETMTPGFKTGQYLTVNLPDYGLNAMYIVQRVTAQSIGGGTYVYKIAIASAKTMGIIRFLIELLEANKNLVEIDPNEVVDELLSVTDRLLSDSLVDALTIDSAGPYSTWCTDSLDAAPSTRAIWDLFQWG